MITERPIDRTRRTVVEEGLQMARRAGWNARTVKLGDVHFEVEAGGRKLSFLHADALDNCPQNGLNTVRLPPPWAAAARAFATAVDCISGHMTVLAPVGCYASDLQTGAIDAVVLAPTLKAPCGKGNGWTASLASVGHTRCWVLNLLGVGPNVSDKTGMQRNLASTDRLTVPSAWMKIHDTATLSEYARDCGRADARFPEIVILAADLCISEHGSRITAWLAFTDAAVSVVLAELIGAAVAPQLSPDERFRQLRSALNADLRVGL